MMRWLDSLPWWFVLIGALALGMAPFAPPHLWQKAVMLWQGEVLRPIDWMDIVMHAALPVAAAVKLVRQIRAKKEGRVL